MKFFEPDSSFEKDASDSDNAIITERKMKKDEADNPESIEISFDDSEEDETNDESEKIASEIFESFDKGDELAADDGKLYESSFYARGINKSKITAISGDVYYGHSFVTKDVKLSPVNPEEVEKISRVFFETEYFQKRKNNFQDRRLQLILGDAHMGKYASAINFAISLSEFGANKIWILRFTENASLSDFLEDDKCPENSVIIIQDAFLVPGINILEIQRYLLQIDLLLQNKNNFVILTSDFKHSIEWKEITENILIEIPEFEKEELKVILDNHLDHYNLLDRKILKAQKNKIVQILRLPYQIDRFCQKLKDDSSELLDARFTEIIEIVANYEEDAKKWFSALTPNEKYYAMLVGLLSECDADKLWDIYESVVAYLQVNNVDLVNPLNFSQEELLNPTETIIRFNSVIFKTTLYKEYIIRQIGNAYKRQFRFLIPLLNELIFKYSTKKTPEYIDIRIILASAFGEIGKASWEQVVQILEKWAHDEKATIRTCVAHALRQTASDENMLGEIDKLIKAWQKNSDPRVRWTAAACLERLYPYYGRDTLTRLGLLASDRNSRVINACAHAYASISQRDIEIIFEWLISHEIISENAMVRKTAAKTFIRIMTENRQSTLFINKESNKLAVLPLISELIKLGGDNTSKGMSIIKPWVSTKNEELKLSIESLILDTYKETPLLVRNTIVEILKLDWVESISEQTSRFALVVLGLIDRLPVLEEHKEESYSSTSELKTIIIDKEDKTKPVEEKSEFFPKILGTIGSSLKGTLMGKSIIDKPVEDAKASKLKGTLIDKFLN